MHACSFVAAVMCIALIAAKEADHESRTNPQQRPLRSTASASRRRLTEGFVPFATNYLRWYAPSNAINPAASNGARPSCPPSKTCMVVVWGDPDTGNSALPDDLTAPEKGKGVVSITPNSRAFAALKEDGSVTAWGDPTGGGSLTLDDLTAPEAGNGVTSIAATATAFAALKADGSVSVWGSATTGGDGAPIAVTNPDPGKHVTSIATTYAAFAALKEDGSVSVWGLPSHGGNGPAELIAPDPGQKVVSIFANINAFAALKLDGSVTAWGNELSGGGADAPGPTNTSGPFASIASNSYGFAALRTDGSIYAWGTHYDLGTPAGAGFKSITGSDGAFAALREDGSVYAWQNNGVVDTAAPTATGFASLASNQYAFVALMDDSSAVAWGDVTYGGGTAAPVNVTNPAEGKGVMSIAASVSALAALREDGSVIAWGSPSYGGAGVSDDLSVPVEGKRAVAIASTRAAFAAIKEDGSVSAWGGESFGSTNVPTIITRPVFGVAAVGIASSFYAFAALVTMPPSDAAFHVAQENDDHLALRVDDEHNDTTYFFVDSEGRMRVNSDVYDEAMETLVVDGSSRFRGDVFLNDDNVPLVELLDGKLSCLQSGMVIQAGKETLNWDDDRWNAAEWMSKNVTLETPVKSATEMVLLTVHDLHHQANPSPLPQVWYTGPIISESDDDAVVGFTLRLVMGADSGLLGVGQTDVAEVSWVMLGIPV